MSIELLEDDFQNQLNDLERLFDAMTNNEDVCNGTDVSPMQFNSSTPGSTHQVPQQHSKQSVFRLAEMDSEKEELQDKLHDLLARFEDFDSQMGKLQEQTPLLSPVHVYKEIFVLNQRNVDLTRENESMKVMILESRGNKIAEATQVTTSSECFNLGVQDVSNNVDQLSKMAELAIQLEFCQKSNEELRIAKEVAEKDFQREKHKRILAQKERDAYSAAYEASLRHFEKWSSAKLKQAQTPSTNS